LDRRLVRHHHERVEQLHAGLQRGRQPLLSATQSGTGEQVEEFRRAFDAIGGQEPMIVDVAIELAGRSG
jgi:hypothetical protein